MRKRPYVNHSHTRVVLQPSSELFCGRAGGTPSAVLVDAEGKDVSEADVGAPAVLELTGARRSESTCS
jgi:hypothetical protein